MTCINDINVQIEEIRKMKLNGVIMETDKAALDNIHSLQENLRQYIQDKYGRIN